MKSSLYFHGKSIFRVTGLQMKRDSSLLHRRTLLKAFTFFSESSTIPLEFKLGSCHKRQKPQAPTLQAPIRNR